MTRAELEADLNEMQASAPVWDGFDDCIIGLDEHDGKPVVVYDGEAMIQTLMDHNEWGHEEAMEYFCFNIECAYIGVQTPIIRFPEIS